MLTISLTKLIVCSDLRDCEEDVANALQSIGGGTTKLSGDKNEIILRKSLINAVESIIQD